MSLFLFLPFLLCDQHTIYTPEVFASLFIVCSPVSQLQFAVHVSLVCLALGGSVIQWNHWQSQRLVTDCLAGRTKFFRDLFFKSQLKLMAAPCIIRMYLVNFIVSSSIL